VAVIITINAVDRTAYCDLKSIDITDSIRANADTLNMEVAVSSTDGWSPQAGNEIVIANGTTKEFGGVVEALDLEQRSATRMRYKLACRDYTYFFDKYLVVDESTSPMPADDWVDRIITGFTTGFTGVNVMGPAPTVAGRQFNYVVASEAVRALADEVGYAWYIDYDKDVHFFPSVTLLAPTTSIDLDTNITDYGDVRFHETVAGAKDRVYLKGYKHKTGMFWNRSFVGDSTTRSWVLGAEPASIASADMVATVDGTALDLLTDYVDGKPGDGTGSSSQLFVSFTEAGTVRMSTAVAALTAAQTLSVNVLVMEEAISMVEDLAAQATLAAREGGDGIHEYAIDNPQMSAFDGSDDLATLNGTIALARYSTPRVTGGFDSFTQGWRAGQQFDLISTRHLGGINQTFYVQQVSKTIVYSTGGNAFLKSHIDFADGVIGI